MILIASYHKTGTYLSKRLFNLYGKLDDSFSYNSTGHFNNVKKVEDRCVLFIRNPLELIVSSVRYNQTGKEKWMRKTIIKGKPYWEHLRDLNYDEKIFFEMEHSAGNIIKFMYDGFKQDKINKCLIIRLEEFFSKDNEINIAHKICNFIKTDFKKMHEAIKIINATKVNATTEKRCYTYKKFFKTKHYQKFKVIFPNDIMEVLGYNRNSTL